MKRIGNMLENGDIKLEFMNSCAIISLREYIEQVTTFTIKANRFSFYTFEHSCIHNFHF